MLKSIFKSVLYFLIYYSGVLKVLILVLTRARKQHCAVILFYHRFHKGKLSGKLLPSLDIMEFEKQVNYLRKRFDFLSMDEIAEKLASESSFERPQVVLTVDDGYLDNYMLAFPVLKKYDIPAIIYLTTGLIGSENGLWVDDLEYGLIHTKVKRFRLEELFGEKYINISTFEKKKQAEGILFSAMVKLENSERRNLIEKIIRILNVDACAYKARKRVMLSWEEVREMSRNGISFGAHTVSHEFLPARTQEDAESEIKKSKEIIENIIGERVRHFAIPNGKKEDFNDELRKFCKNAGFDTIVTTEPGVVSSNADRFSLKRILPPTPLYYFACEIVKYFIFSQKYA